MIQSATIDKTSTWKKDSQGKNYTWRNLSKNDSQKVWTGRKRVRKQPGRKIYIFEQLSMDKGE